VRKYRKDFLKVYNPSRKKGLNKEEVVPLIQRIENSIL
jgi:hypothetical protein